MSTLVSWEQLCFEASELGLDDACEEGRALLSWLWEEVKVLPSAAVKQQLPEAIDHGRDLYGAFMEQFNACFLSESAPGERWVRAALRAQLGFAAPQIVEAVLDRIDSRRVHLLESFRRRYQPCLFGPLLLDRRMLGGYFRRVAWIESRHAPLDQLLGTVSLVPESLRSPFAPCEEDEEPFEGRTQQLANFWATLRFTPLMRLEGLASLALGNLTGHPILARRCQEYLAKRLPSWEQRGEQLTDRVGQVLARLARTEARLTLARHWPRRNENEQELARLRARLENARQRLQRHQDSLLPRPRDVARLLQGLVSRPQGRLRFERIGREIVLFQERVSNGKSLAAQSSAELAELAGDVERHLASRPSNPRVHGLALDERDRRHARLDTWLDLGLEILLRTRRLLARIHPARSESFRPAATWLADVLNLYELAILDRVGVVGGLRLPAWRLEWLLRVD